MVGLSRLTCQSGGSESASQSRGSQMYRYRPFISSASQMTLVESRAARRRLAFSAYLKVLDVSLARLPTKPQPTVTSFLPLFYCSLCFALYVTLQVAFSCLQGMFSQRSSDHFGAPYRTKIHHVDWTDHRHSRVSLVFQQRSRSPPPPQANS